MCNALTYISPRVRSVPSPGERAWEFPTDLLCPIKAQMQQTLYGAFLVCFANTKVSSPLQLTAPEAFSPLSVPSAAAEQVEEGRKLCMPRTCQVRAHAKVGEWPSLNPLPCAQRVPSRTQTVPDSLL